jgi:Domain of unknown function (DUF1887)
MKKALLILVGGRIIPNVLTILNEEPDLIVPIISKDEEKNFERFEKGIRTLFAEKNRSFDWENCWDKTFKVEAFNLEDIKGKCLQAIDKYPGSEWIFNITSATTIMSMGAYEAAKERLAQGIPISCWYLDTAHNNTVCLTGKERGASIFDISLDDYVAVHNRRLDNRVWQKPRADIEEQWLPFANFLVEDLKHLDAHKILIAKIREEIAERKKIAKEKNLSSDVDTTSFTFKINPTIYDILEKAYAVGLLEDLSKDAENCAFKFSKEQFAFFEGTWLELYVWSKISKLEAFKDCRWSQHIVDSDISVTTETARYRDRQNENELDVSAIYKAQLFIFECKTGYDAFKSDTIYKLDSVASTFGGGFVSKFLVTSRSQKEIQDEKFEGKVGIRGIKLITQEKLQNIGQIVEEKAKASEGK